MVSSATSKMLALIASSALIATSSAQKAAVTNDPNKHNEYNEHSEYIVITDRLSIQLPKLIGGEDNNGNCDNDGNCANDSRFNSSQNISYTSQHFAQHIFEMKTAELIEPANSLESLSTATNNADDDSATAAIRYYATWTEGQLCSSKSSTSFELWEESYASLSDCCEEVFGWDYEACCESLEMGGCV